MFVNSVTEPYDLRTKQLFTVIFVLWSDANIAN